MTVMWLCLLFAAALLQSTASSDGVSVECTAPEAEYGKPVTINCTISNTLKEENCTCLSYAWNNMHGNIKCDSGNYTCDWDKKNYLSLTISNFTKEEIYTVNLWTDCGMAKSSHIEVKARMVSPIKDVSPGPTEVPPEATNPVPVMLGILAVIALAIVCALFGKKIMKRIKNRKPQEHWTDPAHQMV
ncbi:hypothetical protein PBY51_001311 [Eleginops maclovinus]|uniref:Uncharacterized protein n=1 Tax=Eleginops maclovinus TaxID=56733 RepID=A0AAN7WVT8_ELEMC|nr:hypothetical protein PBY51_001311 [Eleginops maclovinus]